MVDDPVFVLCSGRCGSMYLVDLLKENGCDAAHEPTPDLWCEHVTKAVRADTGKRIVERIAETRPLHHVEVNNRLSLLADELMSVFGDDATYVHLHRDPWNSVTSQMRNTRNVALEKIYGGESKFSAACVWWKRTNLAPMEAASRHNVDLIDLPFHDLVTGEATPTLETITGNPVEEPSINPRNETETWKREKFPDPSEWFVEESNKLDYIAHPVMKRLGYGAWGTEYWSRYHGK